MDDMMKEDECFDFTKPKLESSFRISKMGQPRVAFGGNNL